MGYSPMDLDSSLDDVIKKRRNTSRNSNNHSNNSHSHSNNNRSKKNNNNQSRSRPAINNNSAKITKHTPPRSNINSRLSTATVGPLFTAKNKPLNQQQQQQQPDPSKIVITKKITATSRLGSQDSNPSITSRLGNSQGNSRPQLSSSIASRLGNSSSSHTIASRIEVPSSSISSRLGSNNVISFKPQYRREEQQQTLRSESTYEERSYQRYEEGPYQGFTIRGISHTNEAPAPIKIKGESGPTTVLITGLDRGSNSMDVRLAMERYGNVLQCEVVRSPTGQSYGEAEVEFSTKMAALDCIAELDNNIVDGYHLRVILREPKRDHNYAQKQIRSVISAPASGKMYSDNMTTRYDIQRQ